MGDLTQVLAEFHSDLARSEHLLRLVKSFKEFGASTVPAEIADGTVGWPEAVQLLEESRARRTDLPILSGSLLLYMAGRFEFFVREVVATIADEICGRSASFDGLPENLKSELRSKTLEIAQNPRKYQFDEVQADAQLQSYLENLRGNVVPPQIISDVLTITDANMKDRMLAEILKRVGLLEIWREIGKQAQMKLLVEKTTDGETTVAAQGRLNKLMDERNQIAHPTTATQFPDSDKVLSHANFLRVLSAVLVDISRVYLTGFGPTAGAGA